MTLIKGGTALAQRASAFRTGAPVSRDATGRVNDAAPPAAGASFTEPNAHEREKTALAARIDGLEAALRAAEEQRETACAEAFKQGRDEGLAAAETREQERLDAVKGALAKALAALEREIDEGRDLAIDIARAALDRLVADPSLYHGLVTETARRNAAGLQRSSIIRLRVSRADFPDAAALTALPPLGHHVKIEADPALEPGACIFDLSLGSLDASIPRQFATIEGVLEQAYRKAASA